MDDFENRLRATRLCECARARRFARTVTQHYERLFLGSGLRMTQFTLLATLAQMGPSSMLALAKQLGLDHATLSRAVAPLEARKLLQSGSAIDARVRIIEVALAGRDLLAELLPRWETAQATAPQFTTFK